MIRTFTNLTRYTSFALILFLITMCIHTIDTYAMGNYVNYPFNPNNSSVKRIVQGTSITNLSFTNTSSWGLGNIWFSNQVTINQTNSSAFNISFGTNYEEGMLNYDKFMFVFYTNNLTESSGVVTWNNAWGTCTIHSVGQGIPNNLVNGTSGVTEVGLNGYAVTCEYSKIQDTTTIQIPLKHSTNPNFIQIWISNWWTFYSDDELTKELITQQQQQIQQQQQTNNKLDEMNDNITNSNTSDADNKGSSFFDGFNTTDHGGISGIVTAPLTSINQLLNGTCVPLTTTYKGKELSLPCGYDFWNKMPEIRNFWNLIGGGLLCYSIIIKLFKLIEKMKNPDDDRVEVLEL